MGVANLPEELYDSTAHDDHTQLVTVQVVASVLIAGHHQQGEGLGDYKQDSLQCTYQIWYFYGAQRVVLAMEHSSKSLANTLRQERTRAAVEVWQPTSLTNTWIAPYIA